MKKIIILTIMVLSVSTINAQLRVDSVGNTHAKSLSIYQDLGSTGNTNPVGLLSRIDGLQQSNKCAIKGFILGFAPGQMNKTSIAVQGYSEECYGSNYGVIGEVPYSSPYTMGAGIYGTNGYTLTNLNMLYAGYFDGDVHMTGNLTLNGTVTASVLNNALPGSQSPRSLSTTEFYDEKVSEQLSSVRAGSFYMAAPEIIAPSIDLRTMEPPTQDVIEDQLKRQTEKNKVLCSRKHYGLNAEELEEVFPDLVYENEDGTKSINYVEMVPILVQAINELTTKIAMLEGNETATKRAIPSATGIDSTDEQITLLSLGQNKPNPFGETTSIAVSVPEDVQTAFLYVYNLNGNKVTQVDIPARGKTSITLSAATLSEGMFLYSLVADGKIVQTRRMIVEK